MVTAEPQAIVGTDIATSTLEFAVRLTDADSGIAGVLDQSTLVWRCTDGQWRIVREHNSSRPLRSDEIGRLFTGCQ
jgi:ketosteroid isomerase-like protein